MKRTMTPGEFRRLPVYDTSEAPYGAEYLNAMLAKQLASKLEHGQRVMFMKNNKTDGHFGINIEILSATIHREEKSNANY